MIIIDNTIIIKDELLEFSAVLASGPGGQHVNKSYTAIQLRFAINSCDMIPKPVRKRLVEQNRNRVNDRGELVIHSQKHRSQYRNKMEAEERLAQMIRRALKPPVKRVKTKPSKASARRRVEGKKQRSQIKQMRRNPIDLD